MIRSDLVEFLRDGICEVLFVKKDGTDRLMKCTLNYDYIPEDMKPLNLVKGEKVLQNLDIVKVFDTEKQGWRSFAVENVQYIKPHESI
tara:strand:- start:477 stop:740 length:264 start_codon:yes stop_codon:yes gene_type:complete